MNFGGPVFVIAIVAICTFGWVLNNWIRAKHGYPLENEWTGMTEKPDQGAAREVQQLTSENAGLKSQVSRLEERIAVLERIATDPAARTAREIEDLR
jgi:hypothetical protein